MPIWRSLRRRVLYSSIPNQVAEYSLEVGLMIWGIFTGLAVATGNPPSRALTILPVWIGICWALLMSGASLTILTGVFLRPTNYLIAQGMYLFGATLGAYAAALLNAGGWHRGGISAGFAFTLAIVASVRGWWLKEREAALMRERERGA